MAVEYPANLIQRIKSGLRTEAGVSSYDPYDAKLLSFPTLDETVAAFDPSPVYLRCKACHGRLLRGLLSPICVYCGATQRRDGGPATISFISTFGCRKLLESLDLDGSEAVPLGTATTKPIGGQNTSNEGLLLSDLLDLDLCWPEDGEETRNSSTGEVPTLSVKPLNLAGVDLEDFFSETKMATSTSISDEQLMPEECINTTDSFLSSAQASVGMLENSQTSFFAENSLVNSEAGEVGDSFSAWEADFQSASSGALPVDTKTADPFLSTPTSNLAGYVDETATLRPGVDITIEVSSEVNDGETKHDSNHVSSWSDSWSQDDLWHTSAKLSSKTVKIIENEDPLENWQDFTSSGGLPDSFLNSWPQTDNPVISESASQMKTEGLAHNLQEMEFGSFFQPDPILRPSDSHKGSTVVNVLQLETSLFDRKESMGASHEDAGNQVTENNETFAARSVDPNIEMLISQMPDLSFMLKSELSIPSKGVVDGSKADSSDEKWKVKNAKVKS